MTITKTFNRLNNKIGIFVLSVLLPLLGISFTLLNPNTTHAQSTSSDLNVSIESTIYLSLTNCDSSDASSVNINIDPSPTGTFKSACQNITVTTNTPGYSLSAKATSSDNTNNLIYQNPTTITPTPTIPATTSTNTFTNPNTLSNNTWGFAMKQQTGMTNTNFDTTYTINDSNNKYANLPVTDTELYSTTTFPAPLTEFTSYYGTKIDYNTLAGIYQTTITYTAVGGEPAPVVNYLNKLVTKNNITTMQGLTSEVCNAAVYDSTNNGINDNNTVTLTDTRNNQQYNVRKMPDNKCWMIDNLKLELTNGMTLTSQDTNVTTDTTVYFTQDGTSTGTAMTGMTGNFTTSGYLTRNGTNSSANSNLDAWRQVDPSNTENCLNNTGTNTDHTYSPDSKTKCGYLYNYYTATAGSLPQSTGAGYASDSICPASWRLPYNTSTNNFTVLNNHMAEPGAPANWLPDGVFRGSLAGGYSNSGFSNQGVSGYYQLARASGTDFSYYTSIFSSIVYMGLTNNNKFNGDAIRCTI